MWRIHISKSSDRVLRKAPIEIRNAFDAWKNIAQMSGTQGLKAINGYRDHALKGEWAGARSSSLNRQWRVIYYPVDNELMIYVLEVTPHDYRRKL